MLHIKKNNNKFLHMLLQTWTKIPFFVGPGEAWANDVMLDTAQIFFVDGSCNQQDGEFHQNVVFFCFQYKQIQHFLD